MTASVFASGFMQRGSDDILIGSGAGAVPMNVTLPVTLPAVAGSTGLVTGAAGAGAADLSPPPQAAAANATAVTKSARMLEPNLMKGRSEVDNSPLCLAGTRDRPTFGATRGGRGRRSVLPVP